MARPTPPSRFLLVGNCIVDEVYDLESYPVEDSKIRAQGYSLHAGGNAANVAFMLQKLLTGDEESVPNHDSVAICAVIGSDALGEFLRRECKLRSVSTAALVTAAGQLPTSKTVVLRNTPSRTCIHVKSCADVDFEAFAEYFNSTSTRQPSWVHFEGRNTMHTLQMMQLVADCRCRTSLELERCRLGDEHLLLAKSPTVCVFSAHYLAHFGYGFDSVASFFVDFLLSKGLGPQDTCIEDGKRRRSLWVATFGSRGSVSCLVSQSKLECECFHLVEDLAASGLQVVDSLGAGDCFLAGLVYHLAEHTSGTSNLTELDAKAAVQFATAVAVRKLQRRGI